MALSLVNKFQEFEIKNKLFNSKAACGIYWWDIVRYEIFTEINNIVIKKYQPSESIKPSFSKVKKIGFVFNDFIYLIKSIIFKKKYFFYLSSRNKYNVGMFKDVIAEPYLKELNSDEVFLLESYGFYKSKERKYYNSLLSVYNKIAKQRRFELPINIEEMLNKEFDLSLSFNEKINKILDVHLKELTFYTFILKLLKPKMVFVVQYGIQKALFSACKSLNIHCVELQHGLINKLHLAYSYPDNVNLSHLDSFPKVIFTFSKFWDKVNYSNVTKINMGKVGCKDSNILPENSESLLVVNANIYTDNLIDFTMKIAEKCDYKIYFKLHPNQVDELDEIKNKLSRFKNIEVVGIERSIDEVIMLVSSVLIIQSTVVYEALQLKRKVLIFKKQNYEVHSDIFNNPNVYLFDNVDDFVILQNNKYIETKESIFFEEFNRKNFLDYIS